MNATNCKKMSKYWEKFWLVFCFRLKSCCKKPLNYSASKTEQVFPLQKVVELKRFKRKVAGKDCQLHIQALVDGRFPFSSENEKLARSSFSFLEEDNMVLPSTLFRIFFSATLVFGHLPSVFHKTKRPWLAAPEEKRKALTEHRDLQKRTVGFPGFPFGTFFLVLTMF